MSTRLAITGSVLLGLAALPLLSLEPVTVRSQSEQFIVRGLPLAQPPASFAPTSGVTYVRLDPTLLTISCERIKEALLRELGMKDQWRGLVYVFLHPVRRDNESIVVTSTRYSDGWSYRVQTPEQVDKARFIKAMVQVLLLEIANRQSGPHAAELPPWLAEGLAAHLQATAPIDLAVEPNTLIVQNERNRDPFALARVRLRAHPPLTLNELNWPREEQFAGANAEVYRSSAHVFVAGLLSLKGGPEQLRRMLGLLPQHLNWQTAFLRAFQPSFPGLIDVDKWWALSVVHFTGRDLLSLWPREETARKLDEILSTPVQLRLKQNELPLTADVNLQSLITEWDYARQAPVLLQKVNHLQALQWRATPELSGLVDAYRQAIEAYLQKRSRASAPPTSPHPPPPSHRLVVNDTIKRLNELDAQREWHRRQMTAKAAPPTQNVP